MKNICDEEMRKGIGFEDDIIKTGSQLIAANLKDVTLKLLGVKTGIFRFFLQVFRKIFKYPRLGSKDDRVGGTNGQEKDAHKFKFSYKFSEN